MPRPRPVAAIEANRRYADERALDDPARLSKAVRVVRLAIQRGRLAIPDVLEGAHPPVELRSAPGGERTC